MQMKINIDFLDDENEILNSSLPESEILKCLKSLKITNVKLMIIF